MTVVTLAKQEAVRVVSVLGGLRDALRQVFVDVKEGKLRLYGADAASTSLFSIGVVPQACSANTVTPVCVDALRLTRSLRGSDDLLSEEITSLEISIEPGELAVTVRTRTGEAHQSFRTIGSDVAVTPEIVERFLVEPFQLRDWVFVKTALKATKDATEIGDVIIQTEPSLVRFTSRDATSSGRVSMEATNVTPRSETVVDKGLLIEAFSQPNSYPPDGVSMSIGPRQPVVVQFNDPTTRLTIALGTRIVD